MIGITLHGKKAQKMNCSLTQGGNSSTVFPAHSLRLGNRPDLVARGFSTDPSRNRARQHRRAAVDECDMSCERQLHSG